MSELQEINCPNCQASIRFQPVTALRPEDAAVDSLIAGELNRLECAECHTEFFYDIPILYRDDDEKRIIYFLPESLCPKLDDALGQLDTLFHEIFADFSESDRPTCRLVTRRAHFIEKISLLQNGYDDRLIEYVKYMLFQHSPGLEPERFELLYDFSDREDGDLKFLAFDRDNGQATYSLEFDTDDYRALEEYFLGTPEAQQQLDELYRNYYVQVSTLLE